MSTLLEEEIIYFLDFRSLQFLVQVPVCRLLDGSFGREEEERREKKGLVYDPKPKRSI